MPSNKESGKAGLQEARSAENNYGRAPLTLVQRFYLNLLLFLATMLRACGFRGLYALASFVSFFIWKLVPKRRKYAVESIMRHLDKNEAEATIIARKSFTSNIMSFLEIVQVKNFMGKDNPNLLPLPDLYLEMQRTERPVVAVLGHFGGWELEGGLLSQFKMGKPQIVVVRNQKSNVLNTFIHRLRSVGTARSIGHRHAAAEVMSTLRAGGTSAFLVDHNCSRDEAVFLPFLGELAAVNAGPAMLALRAKALVCPFFLVRLRNNSTGRFEYKMDVHEPLDTATLEGSISERVEQIARFYSQAVEKMIREYPEQWFWMHKRWKTRPE